jgi:hypothetical protein
MTLLQRLTSALHTRLLMRCAGTRPADVTIGGAARPYLLRWHVIPRNRWFNLYLHWFLRSDDDRALHDHPWPNLSILLHGRYIEHTLAPGGIHHRTLRQAGTRSGWALRPSGRHAHRIELLPGEGTPYSTYDCWTLFITGPAYRHWGFHCPEAGWIPWQQFTAPGRPGEVGPGCDQPTPGANP